jgi:hypothetical protein
MVAMQSLYLLGRDQIEGASNALIEEERTCILARYGCFLVSRDRVGLDDSGQLWVRKSSEIGCHQMRF